MIGIAKKFASQRFKPIKFSALLLGFLPWLALSASADTTQHTLLYVGPEDSSARYGVLQGFKEANHQGRFLNVEFKLKETTPEAFKSEMTADVTAVFVDVDSKVFNTIIAESPGIAVLNLTNPDDSLRSACTDNGLHVTPSQRMLDDAVAQWQEKHPDSSATAQTWQHEFRKYAAKDLSDRYRKQEGQGRDMDDAAWSGWAGVRLVSDVITRQKIHAAEPLLKYMKSELTFDGQKGVEMSFRETGQLRQTLLLIENGKVVDEAPVRGVVDPSDLDTLGLVDCN